MSGVLRRFRTLVVPCGVGLLLAAALAWARLSDPTQPGSYPNPLALVAAALSGGLAGSLADSLLGATLQHAPSVIRSSLSRTSDLQKLYALGAFLVLVSIYNVSRSTRS